MNFKDHRANFNKRWNITSSETPKEAFRKFKQRILNAFNHVENRLTSESVTKFCQYYAIKEKQDRIESTRLSKNIINQLKKENNPIEIYRVIEIILSLQFQSYEDYGNYGGFRQTINYRSEVIESVKEAVEISDVDVRIVQSQNRIILYPKGEKKLDEELVNKTLSFLDDKSNKHFEEALKFYQNKNPIKSAESLRRSLEEFLRYKLKNQKGLKGNIITLQKELKNDSHSEVRNVIFQTFRYLDKYFNEHSKHNDGNIKELENEFLIYQIGLFMKYINKVGSFKKYTDRV